MQITLLSGLTSVGRRIGQHIQSAVRQGLSYSQSLGQIKDLTDIKFKPWEFSKIYTQIESVDKGWQGMKFTGRKSVLRSGYAPTAARLSTNMHTVIRSTVYNSQTGETSDIFTTIAHNENLTRAELEYDAERYLTGDGEKDYLEIRSQRPVQGWAAV